MKIITQSGENLSVHNIEMSGCTIKCIPAANSKKEVVCGMYENVERIIMIFAEMTHLGWSSKSSQYVMPSRTLYSKLCDNRIVNAEVVNE